MYLETPIGRIAMAQMDREIGCHCPRGAYDLRAHVDGGCTPRTCAICQAESDDAATVRDIHPRLSLPRQATLEETPPEPDIIIDDDGTRWTITGKLPPPAPRPSIIRRACVRVWDIACRVGTYVGLGVACVVVAWF